MPNPQKQAYLVNIWSKLILNDCLLYRLKNFNKIHFFPLQGTSNGQATISNYVPIPTTKASPEYLKMSSKISSINENKTKHIPSEPEYITAEFVRQKKMANAASNSLQHGNAAQNNNGKNNSYLYTSHRLEEIIIHKLNTQNLI